MLLYMFLFNQFIFSIIIRVENNFLYLEGFIYLLKFSIIFKVFLNNVNKNLMFYRNLLTNNIKSYLKKLIQSQI